MKINPTLLALALAKLFLIPNVSNAIPTSKFEGTVKVFSGICGQDEKKFRGSGALITNSGKVYVITSNHVVLNGKIGFCHHIQNQALGEMRADLVASDWSAGLALLRIKTTAQTLSLANTPLSQVTPTENDTVPTFGFPYNSNDLFSSQRGYVLNAKSARHWLASSVDMIELMDAHAEYGMSGGPVLASDGSRIIGLLSHQALEMSPGYPTVPQDISEDKSGMVFNHVFVIPADFIRSWIKDVLTNGFVPKVNEIASEQILGNHVVFSGDLEFQMVPRSAMGNKMSSSGVGGGNGSGVGGGNGSGVGGGNGSGVGGDGTGELNQFPETSNELVLEVRIAANSTHTPSFYEKFRWFQDVKKALLLNNRVFISDLLIRDSNPTRPTRMKIESLDHFFRMLIDPSVLPLADVISSEQRIISTKSDSSDSMLSHIHTIQSLVDFLVGRSSKLEEKQLLSRIKTTAEILGSAEWQSVSFSELSAISGESGIYIQGWTQLFDPVDHEKFDAAVKLMSELSILETETHERVNSH